MSVPDWAPSVESVAVYVISRTVQRNGSFVATFSDTTRPTANQVAELADQAAEEVLSVVGGSVPEVLEPTARRVSSILAAADVELTYFPNTLNTDRSAYDRLRDRYREALAALVKSVGELNTSDSSTAASGRALYSFPYDPYPVSERQW